MLTMTDRTVIPIFLFVILAHAVLLLFAIYTNQLTVISKVPEKVKLVVKTIHLKKEKPVEMVAAVISTPKPMPIPEPEPEPVVQAKAEEPIPEPIAEIKEEPLLVRTDQQHEVITTPKPKIHQPKSPPKPVQKSPKPALKPKPVKKTSKPQTKPVAKHPPKKPTTTQKPKEEKLKPSQTTKKPQPKVDQAAEAAKVKRKELLADAQKSISKIQQGHDKVIANAAVLPGSITTLQLETLNANATAEEFTPQQRSYYDELESRLKLQLRLPEYGAVKIKLTLERSGRYVKMAIVSAKSAANRAYIEKMLPTLKYPGFGDHFGDKEQYTFVISLSNDL